MIYVVVLSLDSGDEMHLLRKTQIAHLKADKVPTKVSSKYADFADFFLPKLAAELLEHTRINNYAIELVDDWQPLYGPIYSLSLVELEILKVYIKNNLANCFIRPFKSPTRALIFFDKKPDRNLQLYVDYRGLNSPMIKNRYPLPLIEKLLDWLGWVQRFTQFDLINAYH